MTKAKEQLELLKRDLQECHSHSQAVLISRVIRGIQRALKESIKSPLHSIDFEVPSGAGMTDDHKKIQLLRDNLEFSFRACGRGLTQVLNHVRDPTTSDVERMMRLELLAEVKTVLDRCTCGREAELVSLQPVYIPALPTSPTRGHLKLRSHSISGDNQPLWIYQPQKRRTATLTVGHRHQ